MSWMTLAGFPLPLLRGTFSERDDPAGDQADAADGSRVRTRWGERSTLPGRTKLLTRADANRFKKLIKGLGENWLFSSTTTRYSSRGNGTVSTPTVTTSGGKFTNTGFVTVGSGLTLSFNTYVDPSITDWWIQVWRKETAALDGASGGIFVGTDGYHLYDIMGSGKFFGTALEVPNLKVYRDGVLKADSRIEKWLVFSSSLDLKGISATGVNGAHDYSVLTVRPFKGLTTWPAISAARTVAEALLPETLLGGDCLLDSYALSVGVGEKTVLGSVDRVEPAKANAASRDDKTAREFNARFIDFTLSQSRPDSP